MAGVEGEDKKDQVADDPKKGSVMEAASVLTALGEDEEEQQQQQQQEEAPPSSPKAPAAEAKVPNETQGDEPPEEEKPAAGVSGGERFLPSHKKQDSAPTL